MLTVLLILLYFAFSASFVVVQAGALAVCSPMRCTYSSSKIIIGQGVDLANIPFSIQLLPGEYSPSAVQSIGLEQSMALAGHIDPSPGFNLTATNPPFALTLQPGFVVYSDQFYTGQGDFISLRHSFSNNTISLPPDSGSIAISKDVWVAIRVLGSTHPIILYDTAPFISLNSTIQSISIIDYQSSTCRSQCTGNGVCTASGECACAKGFTGSSCESCAEGFFGPACKPCPSTCDSCDQSSGLCLIPKASTKVKRAQKTCNCLNGQCSRDGNCSCLPGWTNATDLHGVTCAQCAPGFFLTSTGDCQICQRGCSKCADVTGDCISCQKGFILDLTDKQCDQAKGVTSNSTCGPQSFSTGQSCTPCSPSCYSCNGPSSNDCITCQPGSSIFNGNCVTVNSDGVCEGTNGMIANNNKKMCDTCVSKCTSCKIPNYGPASTINQAKCTSCLPGSILSQGKCVSCPSGHFASGSSCKPCSSACVSCVDSADNCLKCKIQLATGKCASTCPDGSFNTTTGVCVPCHSDCATCSGPSFNHCLKCPPERPVFNNGRCLRTCDNKNQFFDHSTSSCQVCDPSCSSCSGPGQCLACSDSSAVLKNGKCLSTNCLVLSGLGMCFN